MIAAVDEPLTDLVCLYSGDLAALREQLLAAESP